MNETNEPRSRYFGDVAAGLHPYLTKLPEPLFDLLKQTARANNTSVNVQLRIILEREFAGSQDVAA